MWCRTVFSPRGFFPPQRRVVKPPVWPSGCCCPPNGFPPPLFSLETHFFLPPPMWWSPGWGPPFGAPPLKDQSLSQIYTPFWVGTNILYKRSTPIKDLNRFPPPIYPLFRPPLDSSQASWNLYRPLITSNGLSLSPKSSL